MFCYQWYEDNLHQLGGVHHIGRKYVRLYLFSKISIHLVLRPHSCPCFDDRQRDENLSALLKVLALLIGD
jgi:hypothetical protein